MKNSILILGICLLLSACTAMLMGGSASQSGGVGDDRRNAQQTSDDRLITANIASSYSKDSMLKAAGIGVVSRMGTVTLTGTVASFDIRDRAVSIARSTQNVRTVNNQIIVNSNR
jgi:osmotically-inducible protein OsmY